VGASTRHAALVQIPWTLLSVGEDLRSLDVICRAGARSCEPVISVHESDAEITITVEMPAAQDGLDYSSTPRPTVGLNGEVGGRRIGGPEFVSPVSGLYWKNVVQGATQEMVNLVPRVIGLAPDQA